MKRIHRIGTITLGSMLVVFGIMFLFHIFFAGLSYLVILKLWPIIFIFLGLEILITNLKQQDENLCYDKTAFFLIVILSFFAMGMAFSEFCISYTNMHISF
jgi:hypothetical protein